MKESLRLKNSVGGLEPYKNEAVMRIVGDINELYSKAGLVVASTSSSASLFEANERISSVGIRSLMERNKRILLGYHAARLSCISSVLGTVSDAPSRLPNMSQAEREFAADYVDCIREYCAGFSGLVDFVNNKEPPRDLFIKIRVNRDCGVVKTEWGQLHLNAGTFHFVRQSDVRSLIEQGLVTHIA